MESRVQLVRERAYALWESEGRPAGREVEHWLRAEAELAPAAPRRRSAAGPHAASGEGRTRGAKRSAAKSAPVESPAEKGTAGRREAVDESAGERGAAKRASDSDARRPRPRARKPKAPAS